MATNAINLSPLFALGNNGFWPTLTRRQPIPAPLASSPQPVVGLGLVKACWALLCHVQGVAVWKQGQTSWEVWLTSASGAGAHVLSGEPSRWYVPFPGYLAAVAGALDVLSARFAGHPAHGQPELVAFSQRWQELLVAVGRAVGAAPPYTEAQLLVAAQDTAATEAMMAGSDALYVALLARQGQGVEVDDAPAPGGLSPSQVDLAWLYALAQPSVATPASVPTQPGQAAPSSTPAVQPVQTEVSKTLVRAIQRGRTALLVGPTGVGKTEAVKQAALVAGATLIKIEGHPGLDDKILFGGVYPDGKGGFSYVEGPLSEAWRYAAEGQRVVLLLDELARMDALYHALLIGALDSLSGAEIAARPKLAWATALLPVALDRAARYRVLSLPNGAVLIAPASHLSVIATTNLGSAYQQATPQLDPALVRRFALRLEVERLEEAARRQILERAGLPDPVAAALVALEEFSVSNTASQGGLLQEALNLGVLLDWGQEALALVEDGTPWPQALTDAAEYTVIPFACPRLADGRLEPPAVNMLRAEVANTVRSL
ncbi:MAG TPA: MoxR family ATPase [Ktedonobacterales bacterium]|nr:MoxR family ATPase [Ktedonobacterales bacterium]